jgi:hypothetical protein
MKIVKESESDRGRYKYIEFQQFLYYNVAEASISAGDPELIAYSSIAMY